MSGITFAMSIPQSYLIYKIIWNDPCSTAFFQSYEILMNWVATTSALDGAAAVALGFIDYKIITGNSKELILAMRKKRLAFAKFSFMMAVVALILVDKPSPSSIFFMIVGQVYSAFKIGT